MHNHQKLLYWSTLIIGLAGLMYEGLSTGSLAVETAGADASQGMTTRETGEQKFQYWIRKCGGEGLTDDQCYITQNIFVQESGLRLLGVAAGYLGPGKEPWIFFTMPLGISLPAGMVFKIDDGDEVKSPIRICMPDGCKASVKLEDKLRHGLEKGLKAKVAFLDGNTQKQITVEVLLDGFSKGFAALKP